MEKKRFTLEKNKIRHEHAFWEQFCRDLLLQHLLNTGSHGCSAPIDNTGMYKWKGLKADA
ncbi:hypothetical protein L195_g051624 [Trifolium pratense]|uniref:Uncharacterized protein n=1 Tax=Trifolium pratense TaxID=57577 RepID=A0A2K3K0P8_TRIPR|nr:hypothetical protein L195_g051624 [Trifolium pratense]